MSYKKSILFPPNPPTERGHSTKISSHKDKVVYSNGRSIIIRDLQSPEASIVYTQHTQPTSVARISPSGYYCASADTVGNVRIWDIVGEDKVLKGEYRIIAGKINDLEWDGESKRIIAVGDGREKFGHAFMADTGSSTGEITGHSKVINAVAIRHQRPFRAATAADDNSIVFYNGAPYKYEKTIRTHTGFVQDVRYAPSGDFFTSVGSDKKIFLYEGKTGDTVAELKDTHSGTIFASSWSPDSKSFSTSSGDGTVKLWDVETKTAKTTWKIGSGVAHQQVGNTWTSGTQDTIISLSLGGDLNVFDPRVGEKPARIIQAPQKSITAIAPTTTEGTFLVGSADGRVLSYSVPAHESTAVNGDGHSNYVSGLATSKGKGYSVGYDDRVREISDGSAFVQGTVATSTQPKAVAVSEDGYVFVAEIGKIEVVKDNQKVLELAAPYEPTSITVKGRGDIAVGGGDNKVHLYEWDGKALNAKEVLEGNRAAVTAVAFSPNGAYLAAGDSAGKLLLFDASKKELITSRWSFHTARVNSLSWTADSKQCASGSLDTHAYIFSVAKPLKNIQIPNAGSHGVNGVLWVGDNKLVTAGADATARTWDVTFHA